MHNRVIYLYTMFLVLVLSACKVGQNYQQPELPAPAQYRTVTTSDTSTIADIGWKEFFTDTTLQGLISRGISYNYDLQLALKRVATSQEQLKQAKMLILPELNLNISGQTTDPSNNSLNGISLGTFLGKSRLEDYTAAVNLTWEADVWGKLRRQKEAALASYLETYEASRAVQTQVVASIAQGFYNLLMLDAQLDIARKNLVLNDSTLLFTRLQRDAGEVTTLAVQQAEALKQSTELLIPQLQQSIALQENALSILTGVAPDTVKRSVTLYQLQVPDQLNAGVPAEVVSRRPDVRASEMALIAATAEVGVAQGAMYPTLSMTAQGGVNSFLASNWFSLPSSLFGTLVGSVSQPIFQRRRLKTNYEVAKIQRDQSVIAFKQSVLNAVGEVSDALVKNNKLKEQEKIAASQVATLQGAIKSAKLLYRSGMANYLEVITAQGNVLNAELNLASVERQRLGAVVDLYRSLGGGWK
ncbi:efflux transporter outer membrane subunit [Foetidibacter luteolus]|uniref:efflux transporter outer membrane subunit n=1 Tax=Foetidibacter luteolus TaxID=2608880 RepID=UPI00129B5200|nr:efflux transporter outer membrane subunit [Foetidibacter luteolus]